MSLRPAIFLDRDGVLNAIIERDGVTASPRTVDEFVLEDDAPQALAAMKAAGYPLYVVTNQPDISRGLMPQAALDAIHDKLRQALPVDDIVFCPHDNHHACGCRKPKPGMLTDLAQKHGVDLSQSWMIGDQDRDIACGIAAGVKTVLLARPYNSGSASTADCVVSSLSQAVAFILASRKTPTPFAEQD